MLLVLRFETPDSFLTGRALYSGWQVPYPLGQSASNPGDTSFVKRHIRLLWITHDRYKLDFGIWLLYMFPITCLFGSDYLRPPIESLEERNPHD